jgi:hypothetical protein
MGNKFRRIICVGNPQEAAMGDHVALHILVDRETKELAQAIAQAEDRSVASLIRQLIRAAASRKRIKVGGEVEANPDRG